ncbi:hypothetical protein MBLNU459_g8324t2 [Dothideomycetes sp. NU459]
MTVTATTYIFASSGFAQTTTVTPLTTSTSFATGIEIETVTLVDIVDATATFTQVPTSYSSSMTTFDTTSTSIIKKSDVLKTMNAIISSQSYQTFCSSMLAYPTPTSEIYVDVTATVTVTVTSINSTKTQTDTIFTTITTTDQTAEQGSAESVFKRGPAASALSTPSDMAVYPTDYISSACAMAVVPPATVTEYFTSSHTKTATNVVDIVSTTVTTSTQTVVSALSTIACSSGLYTQSLYDGSFECGSNSWTYNKTTAGIVADPSAPDGNYVMVLNGTSLISQSYDMGNGGFYHMTLDYAITTLVKGCHLEFNIPGLVNPGIIADGPLSGLHWKTYIGEIEDYCPASGILKIYITCDQPSDANSVKIDAVQLSNPDI